jgi:hypothetical protein
LHSSQFFSSITDAAWKEESLSLGSEGSLARSLAYSMMRQRREMYEKAMITCMAGDYVLSMCGRRLKLRI